MPDRITQDRVDRIDALDTIVHRLENSGLTIEEKMEISINLQIEQTRALKLMLGKNFVEEIQLIEHCQNKHDAKWPAGKVVASVTSVVVVCVTLTGWLFRFAPDKTKEKHNDQEIHIHNDSITRDDHDNDRLPVDGP